MVAATRPSNNADVSTMSFYNYVLDPRFPVMETAPLKYNNTLFDRRFRVLSNCIDTITAMRLTNCELLRCYSFPDEITSLQLDNESFNELLDDAMQYCTPFKIYSSVVNQIIVQAGFAENITYGESESSENFQYYNIAQLPTAIYWTAAYISDPSTQMILYNLLHDKNIIGIINSSHPSSWSTDLI